jgi:hypothetical protein
MAADDEAGLTQKETVLTEETVDETVTDPDEPPGNIKHLEAIHMSSACHVGVPEKAP